MTDCRLVIGLARWSAAWWTVSVHHSGRKPVPVKPVWRFPWPYVQRLPRITASIEVLLPLPLFACLFRLEFVVLELEAI